jgi:ribose transport system permease protein
MSADSTLADVIGKQTNRNALTWLIGRQVFWVTLATIVACVLISMVTDKFASPGNIFNVTRNFAFVGIIAVGMTAVIISGGIDLSVGGTLLISAMVTAYVMSRGMPFYQALPLALLAALAVGFVNGILIANFHMQPFVVTLGMMSIARSLGMVISDNKLTYDFGPDGPILLGFGGGQTFGIPNPVFVLIALMIVTGLLLRWTRWGRYLYAIGGNERAAILTGVPVKTVKVSVYMFAGFCAGLAGVLQTGWLGSAATNLGTGMELTVIAAAVIGGANLVGGSGTAFGAVIGAALIEVIRNSLILLGISTFWQGTFVGCFIILAVAFDRLRNKDSGE